MSWLREDSLATPGASCQVARVGNISGAPAASNPAVRRIPSGFDRPAAGSQESTGRCCVVLLPSVAHSLNSAHGLLRAFSVASGISWGLASVAPRAPRSQHEMYLGNVGVRHVSSLGHALRNVSSDMKISRSGFSERVSLTQQRRCAALFLAFLNAHSASPIWFQPVSLVDVPPSDILAELGISELLASGNWPGFPTLR